jgi:hypothetical protein
MKEVILMVAMVAASFGVSAQTIEELKGDYI